MKSRILSVDKPGSPGLRWGLGALAVVAMTSAIGYSYFNKPSIEPAIVLNPRTLTPQVMAYPTQGPNRAAATLAPATTAAAQKTATLATRIDALVASGKPDDAFVAYKTVVRCLMARGVPGIGLPTQMENIAFRTENPTQKAACGDISPGQITSRVQWVEAAAKANVPDAAWAFMSTGPRGNGFVDQIPSDYDETNPVTVEWLKRQHGYLKTAADTRAELMPVWTMSNFFENHEGDMKTALKYYIAAADLQRMDPQNASRPEWVRTDQSIVQRMSKTLSPEAASQAIADGHQLAKLGGARSKR